MTKFAKILAVIGLAAAALPVAAVTDKEWEEARTITAKTYLRWANDGSGYLDEVSATTMSELQGKLRPKEVENLKAFTAVKVPTDYAGWDKEKFVEFWAVEFFTSPQLDEQGKRARSSVKKKLMAMNVSAPAAQPATPAPAAEAAAPASDMAATEGVPGGAEAAREQEQILNDQKAIEADAADAAESARPKEQSHTWVYVVVLVILILVVVWLVVYAANLMKRQADGEDDFKGEDGGRTLGDSELREQTRIAIAKKNEEVEALRRQLEDEGRRNNDLEMEIERLKSDRKRQDDAILQLREENRRLRLDRQTSANRPEPARTSAEESARAARLSDDSAPKAPVLKTIYLGRANNRGIFVRADRRVSIGNTIYRLDTNDGMVGTFHVVDEPEVVEVALSNPNEYLGNGCIGTDLEETAGVSRIVTESSGTAIFENGYWKIIRKTRIRYE